MLEQFAVGLVYRNSDSKILKDLVPEGAPWKFELFQEQALLGGPAIPRRNFLAVFFAFNEHNQDIHCYLTNIFPGAEIIGCRTPGKFQSGSISRREDGLLMIQLPASFSEINQLLENFALSRAGRSELELFRRRADEMQEILEGFVNAIEASSNPGDRNLSMCILINRVLTRLDADECALYLVSDQGPRRAYSTGNLWDMDRFDHDANNSIIEGVLKTGTPYLNNDFAYRLRAPFGQESILIRSVLCYLLQNKGKKLGAIEFINKNRGIFSDADQSLLESMLNPLAVAVDTIRKFEHAERLTITDDLTTLYNYRYLMRFLEDEVKRCLRYKKKVSLLFIDIDSFKQINDTFGHLIGSQALAEMGQVLRMIVRESDVLGRYGGDEFMVILPETPLSGAMAIAERIRKRVEDFEFIAQNLNIRLTVSLGVATCPKHTLTAEGLIKKADAAMYRAKELSKNSIKVAV